MENEPKNAENEKAIKSTQLELDFNQKPKSIEPPDQVIMTAEEYQRQKDENEGLEYWQK